MTDRPLSRLDPDRIRERLLVLGERWADADAAATLLEELKKTVLARLTLEQQRGDRVSHAQALTAATAAEAYEDHVRAMVEARRVATRARAEWEAGKVWAEMARSANANRRAEMSLGHLAA